MMKKLYFYLLSLPYFSLVKAEEAKHLTIDERIDQAFSPIVEKIFSVLFYPISIGEAQAPIILLWLAAAGIFFTLWFKFINLRIFKLAFNTLRGKYSEDDATGEITHFQALSSALAATVGLGNIAGVAIAIGKGGPGAAFWMVLAGFLGMTTKFAECTLGVKYREIQPDGTIVGGPMFYIKEAFSRIKVGWLGSVFAFIFAVFCIGAAFGAGNMFQANQASSQIAHLLNLPTGSGWLLGLVFAVVVGLVIIGGIRRIAKVTSKLVPLMCAVYLIMGLIVLIAHASELGSAVNLIVQQAFNPDAVVGGLLGVLLIGLQRASFSNEAGIGSAPIAHASVKTNHPASEGVVAALGPFIDTVVVCSMTALVVVVTGAYQIADVDGVTMTSKAVSSVSGSFEVILGVAVILFAISTMISWSYYGQQSWRYIFGCNQRAEYTYKILFCLFIILGSAMKIGSVLDFSDAMLFGMAIPNIIAVVILVPIVSLEFKKYLAYTRKKDAE